MTKKDYVLIATAFLRTKPLNFEAQYQFEKTLEKMILLLEGENPKFDSEKFLDYIGTYDIHAKAV